MALLYLMHLYLRYQPFFVIYLLLSFLAFFFLTKGQGSAVCQVHPGYYNLCLCRNKTELVVVQPVTSRKQLSAAACDIFNEAAIIQHQSILYETLQQSINVSRIIRASVSSICIKATSWHLIQYLFVYHSQPFPHHLCVVIFPLGLFFLHEADISTGFFFAFHHVLVQ